MDDADATPPPVDSSAERTEAVRALEAEFGELISHFRRIWLENANRVSPGMLPAAYKVLTTIARSDGITVSALAERLLTDKGQISRSVRELEGLGLIERSPDPKDRRSAVLTVTDLGRERLTAARAPQEVLLMRTLSDWSLNDIRNLTRLLHALDTGVSPTPDV